MSLALKPEPQQVAAEPIIAVKDMSKLFPISSGLSFRNHSAVHAVSNVSFALYPGRVTALVGESGSGKSTIARLLARVYAPTSGAIEFQGHDVTRRMNRRDLLRYRSQVQMIFQDPFGSLNPVKRVRHHIARPLQIHNVVPKDRIDERIHELLTTVGLVPAEDFAEKYPHQLSGGQRQRVNIARALAVEPTVLLADEPISMLDVSIRMGILNLMHDLKEEKNIAFLYITHDIASARYIADDILVMYAGQVVEQGPTDAVLQNPLHPYTRLLLSSVPNPEAGMKERRVEAKGEIPVVINPKPLCRFASRCPHVMEHCLKDVPQLAEVEPGHWARCYLYPGA